MDRGAHSDLLLLADEKFDFDVSLSPASSSGDEDEVFVGPVGHKERRASVNVASRPEGGGVRASWSPLSEEQLDAVRQEAHRLADQLQCSEPSRPPAAEDEFVRGAEAKLGVLGPTAGALSPIKRQTFCVQDSPMKQLPPAVQRRLLRGSGANPPTSTRPAATSTRHAAPAAAPARPVARRSTSSPAAGVKPLPRAGLRGRAGLGVAVVLPSRSASTTTSCSSRRSGAEKPRMQPPSRPSVGWRRSPSCGRAGSCEDLLSDSTSVASDVSDSSLNSSVLGKRTLAPPTKRALMNPSGVNAPPPQRRRMTERKNTSSSSSSVSSFNSSFSLSPAADRRQSSSTGPAPSISSISRPRRSAAAEPASSAAGRRSLSTQARKLSETERVKAARSTPLKRAEATPLQGTPAKRVLERAASIPTAASARLQSGLKAKSKPEALVVPTPSGRVAQGDAPDVSKPKRLPSVSGVDSLAQKPSAVPLTPSAGSCRSLQGKTRRPSALPTPVRRRMSSIPVATPTRPPPTFDPASARSQRSCSPAPADIQEAEPVDVQPFCLEEEEEPPAAPPTSPPQPSAAPPTSPPQPSAAPPTSPPQPDQSESTDPGAPNQGESEPTKNLIELETTEEKSKTQEVLLLDLPAPFLQPQEKLLIDLTNTPDLIRTSSKTCTSTQQLIDLSSPLIKWSPEEKRENNAPLINLSF